MTEPARWAEHSRNSKFALAAGAMADQGLRPARDASPRSTAARFGVYLGSGEGQQDFPRFVSLVARCTETAASTPPSSPGWASRSSIRFARPSKSRERLQATWRAIFGAKGPNSNCLTACAASSQAIGEAFELIRRGNADVILSGGTHSMIHPFGVTGFILLTALSTRNDEPQQRQPPLRPRPRRLHPGRRGRHARPRRTRACQGDVVHASMAR